MTPEPLHRRYPKIFAKLEDPDVLMRNLVVVDQNEKDVTDDEIMEDIYDPDIYSHVAYLYPEVLEVASALRSDIPATLARRDDVTECYAYEADLWGLVTTLDTNAIAYAVLDTIESMLD